MMRMNLAASLVLACIVTGVAAAVAQEPLTDLLARHGVNTKDGVEAAFDAHAAPAVPVTPGSFATPLALLTTSTGGDRIAAAYAFGILAGPSGRAASPPERAAAGQALVGMIGSDDRKSRIAGARVAGRVFAVPFDSAGARPPLPAGMMEALFALLNRNDETDQLVAMDAIGLVRDASAVTSLTERYYFYREGGKRALAGGALEGLARIGNPSTAKIVAQVAVDKWAAGKDATALAVLFARERLLKDGSTAAILQALEDRGRRNQARGYLAELGVPVP
jgi:hypothetical protein